MLLVADRFTKLTKAIFDMKIRKIENGDILIEFKKFIVWFYPHIHMDISHMKPKTLIKGFLFKSEYYGTSYMIDFYLFKISWKRVIPF